MLYSLFDSKVKDGIHFKFKKEYGKMCNELIPRFDGNFINVRTVYFDIEVFPDVTAYNYMYRFPNGYIPDDKICMISCIYEDSYVVYYWGLENVPERYESYKFIKCRDEKETILQFIKFLKRVDPLFVVCYNGYNYDIPCIMASVYHKFGAEAFDSMFSSTKVGSVNVPILNDHIYFFDYFLFVTRYSGNDLPSFKLNDVAKAKIGKGKVDINILSVHRIYQNFFTKEDLHYGGQNLEWKIKYRIPDVKNPSTPLKCLYYCGEDSKVLMECFKFDKVVPTCYQYSKLLYVNFLDVVFCGNSNLLVRAFKSVGMLQCNFFFSEYNYRNKDCVFMDDGETSISDAIEYHGQKSYPGALNFCKPGVYSDICGLDYESEYPNSMIYANLSPETIIIVSDPTPYLNRTNILVIPYENHETMDDGEPIKLEKFFPDINYKTHKVFIVCDTERLGIIPTFETYLLKHRKIEKNLYKQTRDECYNIRQQLLKILANSLYGVTGASNFRNELACFGVALTTTLMGRYLLKKLKQLCENWGKQVTQADTDGLWIVDTTEDEGRDMEAKINNFFQKIKMENIKVEYEISEKVVCLAKKKYIKCKNSVTSPKGFEKRASPYEKKLLQYCYDKFFTTQQLDIPTFMEIMYRESGNIELFKTTKFKSLSEYDLNNDTEQIRLVQKSNDSGKIVESGDWLSYTYYILDIDEEVANKKNPFLLTKEETHNVDFFKLFKRQEKNVKQLISMRDNVPMSLTNSEWEKYKRIVLTNILFKELIFLSKVLNKNLNVNLFFGVKYNFDESYLERLISEHNLDIDN